MDVKIAPSWKRRLSEEFDKTYFTQLIDFVKQEYQTQTVYPPGKEIFRAFDCCDFDDVKVVIIGQDPYHGVGQANGLCFSVRDGIKMPPSLVNIFKELHKDIGKPIPTSGDLEHWAKQGVLLLNATLTVRSSSPGSHQNKGWESFTDAAIKKMSDEKENDLRRILNMGHTVGHALEAAAKYQRIKHGEAVGYGMIAAARIGTTLEKLADSDRGRIEAVVGSIGRLPAPSSAIVVPRILFPALRLSTGILTRGVQR